MRRPWYLFPMLISALLPGVGQLAKGDVLRAVLAWAWLWSLLLVLVAFPPRTFEGLVSLAVAVVGGWFLNVLDAFVHIPKSEQPRVRIMMDPERKHARPTAS